MTAFRKFLCARSLFAASLITATVALSGCAGGGGMGNLGSLNNLGGLTGGPSENKYTHAYVSTNLIKGKTSVDDVRQKFGSPSDARSGMSGDKETIHWSYTRSKEGLSGLMGIAQKYVSADQVSSLSAANAKVNQAQGALNDVGQVTGQGGNTGDSFTRIEIDFTDGVVTNYSLL
ncbi:MAG: hypothetical protein GAK45_00233 [Pseudomonas citronellolis]|nr:MAG: hypothetical protein GAK45_00233 [Pseudomonas citronellolis]